MSGIVIQGEDNIKELNIDKVEKLAKDLIKLAQDTITVRFRFLDVALSKVKFISKNGLGGFYTDGDNIYYDAKFILKKYMEEPGIGIRGILHMLLHCIFMHQFRYDELDREYWDLATDIAVENIILELEFQPANLSNDSVKKNEIEKIKRKVNNLTADKIYREFMTTPLDNEDKERYGNIFAVDMHDWWAKEEKSELIITKEQWKKISRRIKSEIDNFSKGKEISDSLKKNLSKANADRYDYRQILERFTVMGEEIVTSEDEFDYVYYTYGLTHYGNMPLIELLEYREVKKVKEFVIAIDTSASCSGELINRFITKTYNILKSTENFFNKINIHIIQCDSNIQMDTKISSEVEFHDFIQKGEIKGYGATDFRPVFKHVEELKNNGEFENLKGLIYFTDGYGIYPENIPDYDVIFAFLDEDEAQRNVPGWAIKIIMEDELNEY